MKPIPNSQVQANVQAGFTLLEVILVVLIFGIMSAMAYGGLNSVLKTRTAVEASMKRTADLQKAYLRMRSDFQNLMLRPARDNFGDAQPPLISNRDQILELTRGGWRNPLYLKRSSMERVVYRLKDHNLERASYRVLDRAQDSEPLRMALLEGVDELHWRYLNKEREWVEIWPANDEEGPARATAAPPLAIEVSLVTHDIGQLRFLFKPGSTPMKDVTLPTGATGQAPNGSAGGEVPAEPQINSNNNP